MPGHQAIAGTRTPPSVTQIIGSGTPKEAASAGNAVVLLISAPGGPTLLLMTALAVDLAVCLAIAILPQGRS